MDLHPEGREQPGWRWGLFTFRLPFYHTRLYWPEFLQGVALAAATGLALVPIMMASFGLTFEQAVAVAFVQGFLIGIAPIVFGEPYAPGWVTPALPLVLTFTLTGYDTPTERFQAMTAMCIMLAAMMTVLGLTGLGRRFVEWLPGALKAGIILGAAIASFKRVFLDDAPDYLLAQPISTVLALAVCLILMFSIPFRALKLRSRPLMLLGSLGLLPGFIVAAIVGPMVGEVTYNIQWGFLIPPVHEVWALASPFAIGWPSWEMYLAAAPLAVITYIILFGDIVTANEILRQASQYRSDEKLSLDSTRTHLSVGIRNFLGGIIAPFFPLQGSVWAGGHVVVVQRWQQGKQEMDSLFSGIHSMFFMGVPFIFFLLPLMTGLEPLMGIALTLTLALTGFACAYVAMAIAEHPVERGVALLTGMSIALFEPWIGLLVGLLSAFLLIGGRSAIAMENKVLGLEQERRDETAAAEEKKRSG